MNWGVEDFAAAAAMLVAVTVGVVLARRSVHSEPARTLTLAGIGVIALGIWAHLAVGIWS